MSLPEVVPESSLEVVRPEHGEWQHGGKDPKYIAMAEYRSDITVSSTHFDTGLIPVHAAPTWTDDKGRLVSPGSSKRGVSGRPSMCGLRPWLFWLLLGIGAVVVVATIAGGVGGTTAARSRSASTETAGTSPIAATHSPSSSTTPSPYRTSPTGSATAGNADDGNATSGPAKSLVDGGSKATGSGQYASGAATETTKTTETTETTADLAQTTTAAGKTFTTGTTVISTTTRQPAGTVTDTSPTTATTSKAATTTTASAPAPTFLNNETYSLTGFAFQAFSGTDYLGKVSGVVHDEGFLDLPFSSNSYVWLPNGADCCITFCHDDSTAVGWWCDERRQKDASASFPRVWIGCGSAAHAEHACS